MNWRTATRRRTTEYVYNWERNHDTVGPLQRLERRARRCANSRIGKRAAKRFSHAMQRWLRRILEPGPLEEKLSGQQGDCLNAVACVMVFAILSRFEEYCEVERERSGLKRTFINKTGDDLLEALQRAWRLQDDRLLVELFRVEAENFVGYASEARRVRRFLNQHLSDLRQFASEAAKSAKIQVAATTKFTRRDRSDVEP
ncbi:MAG: hypothetical protein RIC55_05060 [Pirellulaceae bacterium]